MTAVAAYVVLVVVLPALLLGHQGQHWPLAGAWWAVRARQPREARCTPAGAPQTPAPVIRATEAATDALRPRTAPRRPVPSWAHTQPLDHEEAA